VFFITAFIGNPERIVGMFQTLLKNFTKINPGVSGDKFFFFFFCNYFKGDLFSIRRVCIS